MNWQQLTDWCKRVESLLANALRKGAAGSGAAAVGANHATATNNGAAVGPAALVILQQSFVTTKTGVGKVRIIASCQVSIALGTSVAGEQVQFQITRSGAPLAASPQVTAELSATHGVASACLVWEDTSVANASAPYGIQCVNLTTPAHTLTIPANGAVVDVQETL